jgi:uncharacterized membrane protein YqiK
MPTLWEVEMARIDREAEEQEAERIRKAEEMEAERVRKAAEVEAERVRKEAEWRAERKEGRERLEREFDEKQQELVEQYASEQLSFHDSQARFEDLKRQKDSALQIYDAGTFGEETRSDKSEDEAAEDIAKLPGVKGNGGTTKGTAASDGRPMGGLDSSKVSLFIFILLLS